MMDEDFRLETERLLLRPYRLEDLDDLRDVLGSRAHAVVPRAVPA
jgi:RimJ/RimL family protein N-acetyltransferase